MGETNGVVIRKFQPEDREAVRQISCETALMGERASLFFEGDDIFADALTRYFTDFEPESCFVAESQGRVIGYLIGSKNMVLLDRVFQAKILPRLIVKALLSGAFLKRKNIVMVFHFLRSLIRGEFKQPVFSLRYPATLHINIREGFRGSGIGSQLIQAYLDYLAREKVHGVQLATMSDRAKFFFSKLGFKLLHRSKRSYFHYFLHRDVPVYIFGKKLEKSKD